MPALPSLRRQLWLNMLLPAAALALGLGIGGALLIHGVVQSTHDRLLDGSVLAIIERLTNDDGEVTVDLPPVALGMLESQAQDRIYYSVVYDGTTITGYADLPIPDMTRQPVDTLVHVTAWYRGSPIRLAAGTRHLYGKSNVATVAVAETTDARDVVEHQMLVALVVGEIGLLGAVSVLTLRAISRGLAPLATLSLDIARRAGTGPLDLRPLSVASIPFEARVAVLAFNALLERLQRSMSAAQSFTGNASHQLRTPLAVLRTHIELIRRYIPPESVAKAALDDAEGATQRLEHMVQQLLILARADEGDASSQSNSISDLAVCMAEVVSERVPEALEADVEIEIQRLDRPALVRGDSVLVSEIARNLLDNAVRYSHSNGKVRVRVAALPDGVRLDIEDEGPGIPQGERQRVFERFYRIPRIEAPSGSGLGLAIVRTLVESIGAEVGLFDVSSGQGLLATVIFQPASGDTESAISNGNGSPRVGAAPRAGSSQL
jgi:two-component system sensor histidine kinase TctE